MTIEFDDSYLQLLEEQRQTVSAVAERQRHLALLRPGPGEWFLDVGCGSGAYARAIASLVGPEGGVIGVDASSDAVALAAHRSRHVDAGVLSFQEANAHQLPFGDGTFDGAVCIAVLPFCHDPVRVLQELRRVLRPNGRLVVANADEDTRIYNGHNRELGRKVMRAAADRTLDPWIGRRLASLLATSGFRIRQENVEVASERHFRPDQSGYIMAHSLREYLLGPGGIAQDEYERWLADLEACDREGSYFYGRVHFTYMAERSES